MDSRRGYFIAFPPCASLDGCFDGHLDRQVRRGLRGGHVIQGCGEKGGGHAVEKNQTRGQEKGSIKVSWSPCNSWFVWGHVVVKSFIVSFGYV